MNFSLLEAESIDPLSPDLDDDYRYCYARGQGNKKEGIGNEFC